ncbi:MAG TPA: GcrA cell cycle regulator [Devosia sp.]|nr:GcrA cell cycle regulator [Devosia sp.]
MGSSWTEERVSILTKLWMEGLSASQIASELGEGVTRNAVIGKVHRLKLSGRAKPASSSQRTRSATRLPRRAKPNGASSSFKRRVVASRVIGATALKSAEADQENIRVTPNNVTELFIPVKERIGLLGLTEKTCKWPIGDPLLKDFHFCGRDSNENAPYCKFHSKRAYHTMDRKKK